MGETTAISWAGATWNPWIGCTKVSPGCEGCYMFRGQRKYGKDPEDVHRTKTKFDLPLKLKEPTRIFTCSWGDWFHEAADEHRDEAWEIVRACPQHTFMILTKRQGRIRRCLPDDWGDGWPNVWLGVSIESIDYTYRARQLAEIPAALRFMSCEPLLGSLFHPEGPTSGESPAAADAPRQPDAGSIPAGSIDKALDLSGFGWVIVGGESGFREEARPMHSTWAREIRDRVLDLEVAAECCGNAVPECCGQYVGDGECCNEPVPACCQKPVVVAEPRPLFHFKQWGSWGRVGRYSAVRPGDVLVGYDGKTMRAEDAGDLTDPGNPHRLLSAMRWMGEDPDSAGRELDGREWLEIPDRDVTRAVQTDDERQEAIQF